MPRKRVLFVCTGNSARSIMAEALLRHLAGDRFEALSAGMEPAGVHPLTLRVLQENGIATAGLRSKSTRDILRHIRVEHAIVVCDRAQRACPRLQPFALHTHFWPFPDPSAAPGDERERLEVFRAVRDEIAERLAGWVEQSASVA